MTPRDEPRLPRSRRFQTAITAAAAIVALSTVTALLWPDSPGARKPSPTPEASVEPDGAGTGEAYRPHVHVTPSEHWMNDPQRPIKIDGLWHFYYLYNSDYPAGNGTAWHHVTSTDLVHWRDEGVAIEKYRNGLGDIETGSVVVDEHNTAGFGAGAVLAIVTQQHDGVQRQSLFVSDDGGYSFEDSGRNPVLDNPGTKDFRDPKVFWDSGAGQWTMALAEGDKIGFYSSPDLLSWTYRSGFERDDLGLLECPDLFPLALDGDEDNQRWILLTGANGEGYGMSHGTAYWVGDWDGETFTPESAEPRWLDHGADYYAAVTWDDPGAPAGAEPGGRYALGWMNNWTYAGLLPTEKWHGGQDSIVRSIDLKTVDGEPALVSAPVDTMDDLEGPPVLDTRVEVGGGTFAAIGREPSGAYRLRAAFDVAASDGIDELRLHFGSTEASFATVGYNAAEQVAFLARDADAAAPDMPEEYREVRTAPAEPIDGVVTLDIIVDEASLEVFVNDGRSTLSSLVYREAGSDALSVEAVGDGTAFVPDLSIAPLKGAPVERTSDRAAR